MFTEALFIIAQTWKQPGCHSVAEWINSSISKQPNIIQHEKEMSYRVMKIHGGNLNSY